MALPEVAYSDYTAWGGTAGEDAFDASIRAAAARVRYAMGYNVPETDAEVAAYKAAVCAAVDVDRAYGASGGIGESGGSLSIGSFSIGGSRDSANGQSAYDADMERAIHGELTGTRLLFQGIG